MGDQQGAEEPELVIPRRDQGPPASWWTPPAEPHQTLPKRTVEYRSISWQRVVVIGVLVVVLVTSALGMLAPMLGWRASGTSDAFAFLFGGIFQVLGWWTVIHLYVRR